MKAAMVLVALMLAVPAEAQTDFTIRGFADVGSTTFTATESFKAVLGGNRGLVFGGGVETVLPWRIFASLRASRFRETGERLFVLNGQQFDLNIPTTITVTPIELTGGYRFDVSARVVPYAGAGIGWHRYEETSQFAEASENVKERFTGYHVLGGVEVRAARWLGGAFEAQWATVPDALGSDPNGVSKEFGETNLGGVTARVKVVIGR
jgi:opacity protein-like surface antigen